MKVKKIILILSFVISTGYSQVDFSVGGYFGGGSFSGNSPSIGGFSTGLFTEVNLPLFAEVYPRVSFIFMKDFNAILPNTHKPYYPYLLGFSFKGVTYQYFDNKFYLEESVGLLALNDRTFSDTDILDYGVVLSFAGGYDFRNFDLNGFKAGLSAEYGITFFNTLPQYFSLHLFVHYTI